MATLGTQNLAIAQQLDPAKRKRFEELIGYLPEAGYSIGFTDLGDANTFLDDPYQYLKTSGYAPDSVLNQFQANSGMGAVPGPGVEEQIAPITTTTTPVDAGPVSTAGKVLHAEGMQDLDLSKFSHLSPAAQSAMEKGFRDAAAAAGKTVTMSGGTAPAVTPTSMTTTGAGTAPTNEQNMEFFATYGKRKGEPGFVASFDFNSDNVIDYNDFLKFAKGAGNIISPDPGSVSTPETTTPTNGQVSGVELNDPFQTTGPRTMEQIQAANRQALKDYQAGKITDQQYQQILSDSAKEMTGLNKTSTTVGTDQGTTLNDPLKTETAPVTTGPGSVSTPEKVTKIGNYFLKGGVYYASEADALAGRNPITTPEAKTEEQARQDAERATEQAAASSAEPESVSAPDTTGETVPSPTTPTESPATDAAPAVADETAPPAAGAGTTETWDGFLGNTSASGVTGQAATSDIWDKLISDALTLSFDPTAMTTEAEAAIDRDAQREREALARIYEMSPGGIESGNAQRAYEDLAARVVEAKSAARQNIQKMTSDENRANMQTLLGVATQTDLTAYQNKNLELQRYLGEGELLGSLNGKDTLAAKRLSVDELNSAMQRATMRGESTGEFTDPQTGISYRTLNQQKMDLSVKAFNVDETNAALNRAIAKGNATGEFVDPETGVTTTTLLAKQFDLSVEELQFRRDTVSKQLGIETQKMENAMTQFYFSMEENARQFDISTVEGKRQFDEKMEQASEEFIASLDLDKQKLKLLEDQFGWAKFSDKAKGIASAVAGIGTYAAENWETLKKVGSAVKDLFSSGTGAVAGAAAAGTGTALAGGGLLTSGALPAAGVYGNVAAGGTANLIGGSSTAAASGGGSGSLATLASSAGVPLALMAAMSLPQWGYSSGPDSTSLIDLKKHNENIIANLERQAQAAGMTVEEYQKTLPADAERVLINLQEAIARREKLQMDLSGGVYGGIDLGSLTLDEIALLGQQGKI